MAASDADRKSIERQPDVPLRWEGLDNARASRVVTYRPGSIEATDKELEELQDWAIETAIKFRRVFDKRLAVLSGKEVTSS